MDVSNAVQEMGEVTKETLMNKIKINIWGRDFELYISYHIFPGENITETQMHTSEAISQIDFTDSLGEVKKYIVKDNSELFGSRSIDNIFKYVKPKCIMVARSKQEHIFAIMCDYKFDMEHGLAVVYENGIFKQVGPQDIIL